MRQQQRAATASAGGQADAPFHAALFLLLGGPRLAQPLLGLPDVLLPPAGEGRELTVRKVSSGKESEA